MRSYAEDAQAIALIQWRDTYARKHPELGLLFHVANGGKRNAREAQRLKAMGVLAGVSDYFLPVPNHRPVYCAGLWIELKAEKGRLSKAQDDWIEAMLKQGFAAHVCYGWVAAAREIADYLGLPEIAPK